MLDFLKLRSPYLALLSQSARIATISGENSHEELEVRFLWAPSKEKKKRIGLQKLFDFFENRAKLSENMRDFLCFFVVFRHVDLTRSVRHGHLSYRD